jgi:spore coat protein U-like protein
MISPYAIRFAGILLLATTACALSFDASAAYSCTLSITAIATVYSPTVATPNDSTGSYTINCTRTGGSDSTMNYTLRADDGNQPVGGGGVTQNRVQFGGAANRYTYELYRNAGYTQVWGDTGGTDINGTLNFGGAATATFTGPFYLRVFAPQAEDPAGTYTDTVDVALNPEGGGNTATALLNVTVITLDACQINVRPGPVAFNYTSFQGAPAVGSNSFGVRCTTGLPYSMSLDATSVVDNAVNLSYTLALSTTSSAGTGITQNFAVNGTMPAGQSGVCGGGVCTNASSTNKTRTLTITY